MNLRLLNLPSFADVKHWLTAEYRSPGTRQTIVLFVGNIGRFVLSFAASVIIARLVGLTDYGLLALVSTMLTIVDTLGDLGLTNAAVRALSRAQHSHPERVRWLTGGYFSLALLANIVAATAGIIFAEPIARLILNRPDAAPYVRIALLGLLPAAGSGFVTTLLQASRRFGALSILHIVTAFSYLIGILALAAAGRLDVTAVVPWGVINPLVTFVVGLRLLPAGAVSLGQAFGPQARAAWAELLAFGKWLWASTILILLVTRLDLIMLGRWASPAAVGIYALAFNLAMRMSIVNQTRLTVLLPHVSALHQPGQMRSYVLRTLARSAPLAAIFVLAIPFLPPFIVAVYGSAFADAAPVLSILTLSVAFDLVATPLTLLGYPLDQPWALMASEAVQVAVLIAAGGLLIPSLGPIGAALARLISRIVGTAFVLAVCVIRLRAMHDAAIPQAE